MNVNKCTEQYKIHNTGDPSQKALKPRNTTGQNILVVINPDLCCNYTCRRPMKQGEPKCFIDA